MAKPLHELITDWRKSQSEMNKVTTALPRIIGNEAVKVVQDNFRLQGYDSGQGVTKWEARKESTNKRYDKRSGVKGSVFNSAKKILDQTSNLKDSVHYEVSGNVVNIGVNPNTIPYAQIHNEGLKGSAWGMHPFVMAKRQYLPLASEGPNQKVLNAIRKKLTYEIGKAMAIFKR